MNSKEALRLMRPTHCVKNGFIFLPIVFALRFFEPQLWFLTSIAFISFTLTASAVYVFNDMMDVQEDRCHPVKRNRPLALGTVTTLQARWLVGILLLLGVSVALISGPGLALLEAFYFVLNIGYSLVFKHYAILDVAVLSTGFVIRLFAGSLVGTIELSMWIVLMTFLLALFLAFTKRRNDVLVSAELGVMFRRAVSGYTVDMLNGFIFMMGTSVLVCYIMYTVSPEVTIRTGTHHLYLTVAFVLLGILRYIQLTFVDKSAGDPTEVLLRDRFLQVCIAGWLVSSVLILWFAKGSSIG